MTEKLSRRQKRTTEASQDYKDNNIWLMKGDCLERMKEIPDGSVENL